MNLASFWLVTADLPALVAFYQTITGCPPVGTNDYVEIKTARSVLALCTRRAAETPNGSVMTAANIPSSILEFEVGDVDAERSRLARSVTDWVREPTDRPSGRRSMLLRDPDGNLVKLFTPPRPQHGPKDRYRQRRPVSGQEFFRPSPRP